MDLETPQGASDSSEAPPLVSRERKCTVEDCTNRHYAKDFCKKHYAQVLRHGKLTPERERGAVRVCKAPNCGRTDTIQWYCRKHARQIRVHGKLTPEREHIMGFEGCQLKGCDQPHRAKGFCAKHYNQDRWKRLKAGRDAKVRKAAKKVVKKKVVKKKGR